MTETTNGYGRVVQHDTTARTSDGVELSFTPASGMEGVFDPVQTQRQRDAWTQEHEASVAINGVDGRVGV